MRILRAREASRVRAKVRTSVGTLQVVSTAATAATFCFECFDSLGERSDLALCTVGSILSIRR